MNGNIYLSSSSLSDLSINSSSLMTPGRTTSPTTEWVKIEPIEMVEIERGEDDIKSDAVFNPARQFSKQN